MKSTLRKDARKQPHGPDPPTESHTPPILPQGSPQRENQRGILFMVLSVTLFAGHTLILRHLGASRSVDFSVALLFRAVIGAIIVFAFFPSRRPLQIKPVFTKPQLIWRGILGIIGTAAFYWSIPQLGAGKATMFSNTYVLFGTVFAAAFLHEYLSRIRIISLIVAFGGLVILSSAIPADGSGHNTLAVAVALFGALIAAAAVVLIRHLTLHYSNSTIFLSQCAWIAIAALPLVLVRGEWSLNTHDIGFLTAAAAMAAYGQLAMVQGFRLLNVATGASIQMALPVVTALGGFAFFGEAFTPTQLAGAALLLAGTYFVATRK
ncbi:MAG: DMT family transporter [Verrucomicrobiota bacterium]